MKKAVVFLLLTMPFIMIVLISFAAMIVATYTTVRVEGVRFTNEFNIMYENGATINVPLGTSTQLRFIVFPTFATDQSVHFTSSNTAVFEVTYSGVVHAKATGRASATIWTNDQNFSSFIIINVTDATIERITIAVGGDVIANSEGNLVGEVNMNHRETIEFIPSVELPSEVADRGVTWEVDDPSVASITLTPRGALVHALTPGQTTLRVTTNSAGITGERLTASVILTVSTDPASFRFISTMVNMDNLDMSAIHLFHDGTLGHGFLVNETGRPNTDVEFRIAMGANNAVINNGILTVNTRDTIWIEAFIPDTNFVATIIFF